MSTLLLRLAAPLQAWGIDSKFDTRATNREPTKSGVIGILASALGIKRTDAGALKELTELNFGIRVDREGRQLRDFHMVHGIKSSYVTYRYYLCDAVFLCGLESSDTALLNKYAYALMHPVYPLFLGRRSCPPTLPLVLGVRPADLETALREEPRQADTDDCQRMLLDTADNRNFAVVKDVPVSFSPRRREFGYRRLREIILSGNKRMDHDAFAEVEAENVPDTHGT